MKISHVGIAVYSLEEALKFYRDILKLSVSEIEEIKEEGVRVAILPLGESRLELLEPLNEKSPLCKFLEKHGEGMHHLALSNPRLEEEVNRIAQNGIRVLGPLRKGAKNSRITFAHPKDTHGLLIEFCQENPQAP